MNEMRKLMERLDEIESDQIQVTESRPDPLDVLETLNNIYDQLMDSVNELEDVLRGVPNRNLQERARRMVLAHLQMALNNNHSWMGKNMTTLAEVIQEFEDEIRYGDDDDDTDDRF